MGKNQDPGKTSRIRNIVKNGQNFSLPQTDSRQWVSMESGNPVRQEGGRPVTCQKPDRQKAFKNECSYSQKRNCVATVPISNFMCLWAIYIFPPSIYLFCCRKYVDCSRKYINRSQTHECGNWDWGRAIPRKGIRKWDFRCSVGRQTTGPLLLDSLPGGQRICDNKTVEYSLLSCNIWKKDQLKWSFKSRSVANIQWCIFIQNTKNLPTVNTTANFFIYFSKLT